MSDVSEEFNTVKQRKFIIEGSSSHKLLFDYFTVKINSPDSYSLRWCAGTKI